MFMVAMFSPREYSMYANICFILAIICFLLDGLGLFHNLHLLSWGSALFTAGFVTWEILFMQQRRAERKAREKADR